MGMDELGRFSAIVLKSPFCNFLFGIYTTGSFEKGKKLDLCEANLFLIE